jgi:predicted membrane metal-binding protein
VILVSFLFDWALITLSSLAGAALVIQAFSPQGQGALGGILFFLLFIAGVILQGFLLHRERATTASS